jgi:hypothetical protein
MTGRIGICALCKETRNLCRSHYIPAGVYRLLRSIGESPFRLNDEGTYQDDYQIYDYFLCEECEERFNKNGERWFLQHAARASGFPLWSLLNYAEPEQVSPRLKLYRASRISAINVDALIYFAASLFWRASAHTWKLRSKEYSKIDLGPFQDHLRCFLLGQASFPSEMVLWVSVPETVTPIWALSLMPHGGREDLYHRYRLVVLGVMFDLFVSRNLPAFLSYTCIVRGEDNPVLRTNMLEETLIESMKGRSLQNPGFLSEPKKRNI